MRKRYLLMLLLLLPLAAIIMPSPAYAADPDKSEYDKALEAVKTGGYYICTEVDGVKFYLQTDGSLGESIEGEEPFLFTVNQVSGGALYDIGWHIEGANGHFSNTTLTDSKANLHPGTGVFRLDTGNNRNDWESQVLYMNEDGMIAIRSCNTAYGESSWADAGRAFWTYEVDEAGEVAWTGFGTPDPCYSYDPAYIWSFELPAEATMILNVLNELYSTYENYSYDPEHLNMGTDPGQRSDYDSYEKFLELFQQVSDYLGAVMDGYDPSDPDAITLEQAEALKAEIDSVYQVIIDSEVPYPLPNGDGYYRIYAHNRYVTNTVTDEDGNVTYELVDKAIAASYSKAHENKLVYSTLDKGLANFVWKFTQHGDSVLLQNVGMGTYISLESSSQILMTDDPEKASHVRLDYALADYVEPGGVGSEKDIFCIRLAGTHANVPGSTESKYFHQNGHGSVANDESPWGNYGTDTKQEQEMGFWQRTWDTGRTTDLYTSEWFLEFVPESEVEDLIEKFGPIKDHDLLVATNQELRDKVLAAIEDAKDPIVTAYITSADQLSSPNSDEVEGTNIGNLIDGDTGTFWHTSWHSSNQEPQMAYDGGSYHYLQITGLDNMVGDIQLYFAQRNGATNDHPSKVAILGTDNLKNEDDEWEEIAILDIPNVGYAAENTVPFTAEQGYPYVRFIVLEVKTNEGAAMEHRTYWHASEIQFYKVEENPNSQFIALGEVATNLEKVYNENLALSDDEITPEAYAALLDAYEKFMGGMVDPTELRNALKAYAKTTEGVVKGTEPGQWASTEVSDAYNALYKEADDYNKSGKYSLAQIHKYAAMLKAMAKSVAEGANVVTTDKWYRIMFPTEEMYDVYGFNKDGGDNCTDLAPEDQKTMWGTFVSAAKLESEEVTEYDDDGNEVTKTNNWLEAIGGDDLRESDRLFFVNDDDIEDKAASMFRFIEIPAEGADYGTLLRDVEDNMALAIDISTTYTKGEALITSVSQLSSNASDEAEGKDLGALIDGNASTFWHSDWHQKVIAHPYLQVAMNEPVSGLIEVDVVRRNNTFGHIERMYIQGSNDAEEWTNIGYMYVPYGGSGGESSHSEAIDLGGSYKYLRFINTRRVELDYDFDPFATPVKDKYNTADPEGYSYFHSAEFQIYPLTVNEQSESAKALQSTLSATSKIVLSSATAEDLAAASQAYKSYQSEFNTSVGKAVLPNGKDKVDPVYALQNKATGLFVMVSGTGNQNEIYLRTVPTIVGYKALGYERSLLSAKTVEGVSCNNLHAGETNRRFCTWSSTEVTTNSGLVIREADEEYAAPTGFTFTKDIKPGRIYNWCNSVDLTNEGEGKAYSPLGWYYVEDEGQYLALKEIELIPAGQPAFYIYEDTTSYDSEADDAEPMKFTMPSGDELVLKGDTLNGVIGSMVNHTMQAHEIYFSGNHPVCIGKTGYYIGAINAVLDLGSCPAVDPEGDYDFSIFLGDEAEIADGVKTVPDAIEKISQRGNVYSMDGKLLMTGATLSSLKTLGKGMYILNGVKVLVK